MTQIPGKVNILGIKYNKLKLDLLSGITNIKLQETLYRMVARFEKMWIHPRKILISTLVSVFAISQIEF